MLPLLLIVLTAPKDGASAATPLPSKAALFVVAKEGGDEAASAAHATILRELEDVKVPLVDLDAVFVTPSTDAGIDKLLKEAREAYDNLDYDVATAKYKEALETMSRTPAVASTQALADAHFFLAVLATQAGKSQAKKAQEEFARALLFDPDLKLDAKTYGADAKKLFEKAVQEVATRQQASLKVDSTPRGAHVSLRGKVLGTTPLVDTAPVAVGRHLLTLALPGYEGQQVFADISRDGSRIIANLKPAPGYAEALEAGVALSSAVGSGKVPSGARKLGEVMHARFLVMGVTSDSTTTLEVWDTETRSQLGGLTLSDDASTHAAVKKVKDFVTNPSVVKSARVAAADPVGRVEETSGDEPVYKKWWFWTAVGVVVVGSTVGGIAAASAPRLQPYNVILGTP